MADQRPRIRAGVRVIRQWFRGERWHVLEDPASGLFYRLNDSGYDLIARLDGVTTVNAAWRAGLERLGDDSLTQGEALGLLGQLSRANLIRADGPGDVETMAERLRERRGREMRSVLASLLWLRVPLVDPDAFLTRWAPVLAWLFSPVGTLVWLLLVIVGAWHTIDGGGALLRGADAVLAAGNLPWLLAMYVVIKLLHELGHGLACKVFGLRNRRGGEVRTIGLMFLVFLPVPYVDASSAWAFRCRRQRVTVSAAGILVELGIAAASAIVWARSAEGTLVHALAADAVLIASVSTVLFNGNPLLRYDGYYVLADLLGMPNLWSRSREYLAYLVKRFAWGVRRPMNPARSPREAGMLGAYGLASVAYQAVVFVGIALFIASQQFVLGALLIAFGVAAWGVLPLGRLAHHLLRHHELDRTRGRAMLVSAAAIAVVLIPVATVPVPDRARAEGVAEPAEFEVVHAAVDGFIEETLPTGSMAGAAVGPPLVLLRNERLLHDLAVLEAEAERVRVLRAVALRDDPARAWPLARQMEAMARERERAAERIEGLRVEARVAGEWVAPMMDRMIGARVTRGERLGVVADLSRMRVRAVLGQRSAALVIDEGSAVVEVRANGRAGPIVRAAVARLLPAGKRTLPAESLSVAGGGETATEGGEGGPARTTEDVFEAWLDLPAGHGLKAGQRVVVRFELARKPLLAQWIRAARQVFQERFRI